MESELICKSYRLHIKSAQGDGSFSGYASAHSLDSDGEIVDPGAFARTLTNSKGIFPLLWGHDRDVPIGWSTSAAEDEHGLMIHGKLLMESEQGKYAFNFIQVGLAVGGKPGLSIGFQVPKGGDYYKEGIRHFKDVALREVSLCVFQANPDAVVMATKGAVTYQDLPLADEARAWDADAAKARLATWAGGPDKIAWSKYRRGFLYVDSSAPEELGSYKLPIADLISGRLMAVPRGIFAAAGGHGVNAADIPDADKAKIRTVISKYYRKMKRDSPFKADEGLVREKGEGGEDMSVNEFKADDFMSTMQQNADLGNHYDQKYKMDSALRQVMSKIHEDKSIPAEEKKRKMATSLDQHCKCMKAWWGKLVDITSPDDEDVEDDADKQADILARLAKGEKLTAKEGRVISAATKSKLDKCMGAIKDSMMHSEDSHDCKVKALGHLTDLSTGRYWNDVNPPNPVGGHVTSPDAGDTTNPLGGGKSAADLAAEDALMKSLESLKGSFKKQLTLVGK